MQADFDIRADIDFSNFVNGFKPLVKLQRMRLMLTNRVTKRFCKSRQLSQGLQQMVDKEKLAEEFKTALPNLHLTINTPKWEYPSDTGD